LLNTSDEHPHLLDSNARIRLVKPFLDWGKRKASFEDIKKKGRESTGRLLGEKEGVG